MHACALSTANLPLHRGLWAAALVLLTAVLVQVTAAQTATWKDSETLWTCALKANPEIALAENNLGMNDQSKGQWDAAFKRYQHAVEIRPRYVEAQINLGNVYMVKAQTLKPMDVQMFTKLTDEAMKHYRAAIDVRPDFELTYVNLATALIARGNLPGAEANFRTALEKDPRYVEAYWKLGRVLCQEKKIAEGSQRTTQGGRDRPKLHSCLGDIGPGRARAIQSGTPRRGHSVLRNSLATPGNRERGHGNPRLSLLREARAAQGPGVLEELSGRQPRFAARAHDDGLAPGLRSGPGHPQRRQVPGAGPAGRKTLAGPGSAGFGGAGGGNGRKRRFCKGRPNHRAGEAVARYAAF